MVNLNGLSRVRKHGMRGRRLEHLASRRFSRYSSRP
jgi:hypothetical protein